MSLGMGNGRSTWDILPPLAAIAIGAVFLVLAIPTAMSDLLSIPGNHVMKQLKNKQKVGKSELQRFIDSYEASATWKETAKTRTDIALGYLILVNYLDLDHRSGSLLLADASLRRGLALAPMNPYGWMRLVQIRKARKAPLKNIADPFKISLKSGHHEDRHHEMLLLMVETGLEVWSQLGDEERTIISRKARKAWERDPRRTATLAVRIERSELLSTLLGF